MFPVPQQAWPAPPQAEHTAPPAEIVHERSSRHWLLVPPEQHAAPAVPHATHVPSEHVLPEAVHVSALVLPASTPPPQQGWPMPPHGVFVVGSVHEPVAEQVPLIPLPVHSSPTAMQVSVVRLPVVTGMQQPLAVQALPAQQG